jgi:hypothetical protein
VLRLKVLLNQIITDIKVLNNQTKKAPAGAFFMMQALTLSRMFATGIGVEKPRLAKPSA